MKKLSKKSYPKETLAKQHLAAKWGVKESQIKLKKTHRRDWIFEVTEEAEKEEKPTWFVFLQQYRAANPDVPYREAMKQAAAEYKNL